MNKNGRYAFYGTLRHGMENHSFYGGAMTFLESVLLSGYKLYSLGDYPYAVRSDTGSIVADLFQVNDMRIGKSIHQMELDAGYHYDEIIIASRSYGIYLFVNPAPGDEEIRSGDWVRYVNEIGF
jgi:gamma-glutamylcyclotransferase (GGCT)/AIG2-like uncharacterized protein YtfP